MITVAGVLLVLKWSFIPLAIGLFVGLIFDCQADNCGHNYPIWPKFFYFSLIFWAILFLIRGVFYA